MKPLPLALGIAAALTLAGCTTPPGPVEVTRFVAPDRMAQLGQGRIFVETAAGVQEDSLALAPYKAAVADELRRLGYVESDRGNAGQIAQISLERYVIGSGGRRSPVSVGVGGSTGSYGSGVGVGIGVGVGHRRGHRHGGCLGLFLKRLPPEPTSWRNV